MRIKVVTVYVTDQEKAKAFYTNTLGFTLRDDAPYGPGFRWLTVVSPEDNHTELYLAHQDRYAGGQAYRQVMYDAGTPVVGFAVDDIARVHQSLAAQGITFIRQPRAEEYGGFGACIDDGCGNIIYLHQKA